VTYNLKVILIPFNSTRPKSHGLFIRLLYLFIDYSFFILIYFICSLTLCCLYSIIYISHYLVHLTTYKIITNSTLQNHNQTTPLYKWHGLEPHYITINQPHENPLHITSIHGHNEKLTKPFQNSSQSVPISM